MELSNLTRQYVEALIREGDDFDSSAWFWKMKKEKAEGNASPFKASKVNSGLRT